jgi:hypothetical protein
MTKVSEHFILEEFINPDTFKREKDNGLSLIDKKLFDIAEFIRVDLGVPITINDWHTGGQYHESGLRDKNSTTGAKLSQHKLGKAIDVKAKGYGGAEWYDYVKKNAKKLYDLGVRRIEDKSIATTWLHIDTKEHGGNFIEVVDLVKIVEEIKIT